jgi:hypothetical protein
MLSLWYYFWDQAAWSQNVTGTADVRLRGIKCSAVGEVPSLAPAAGGWKEYEHILSLNRPHWSAPRWPKVDPVLVPKPEEQPVIVGSITCSQGHGEVMAEGEMVDQELEMLLAIVIGA